MTDTEKIKPNEMPELTSPRGCEAIWTVDGQQGKDMHMTPDTMAAYAASKLPLDATNASLSTLSSVVSPGATPALAVYFPAVPTVHVDNPTTIPNPLTVSGTVNVGNQQPFPSTMVVTIAAGQVVGITNAVKLDPSVTMPVMNPAMKAALAGAMFAASVPPVNLSATAAVIGMLVNPAGSGKTLYVDGSVFGAGLNAFVARYRLATIPASPGTAVAASNLAGVAATPVGKFYTGIALPSGAVLERAAFVPGGSTETVALDGKVAVPPGQAVAWTGVATGALTGLTGLLLQGTHTVPWWEA